MSQIVKCPFLKFAKKDNLTEINSNMIKRLVNLCPHLRKMSHVEQNSIIILKKKLF